MSTHRTRRVRDIAVTLTRVPNAAGELSSDVVETAGLRLAAHLARRKAAWIRWTGSLVESVAALAGAAVKCLWDLAGSCLAVPVLALGGVATASPRLFLAAATELPAAIVGGLVVLLGRLISLVQTAVGLESPPRAPTADEARLLTAVFGPSLPLAALRIAPGRAGLFGTNDRPFVLGNTIYLKGAAPEGGLLVHEATHVWQYRHRGARYAPEAILAQVTMRDAYDWAAHLEHGARRWEVLNPEAQAQMIEDLWRAGGVTLMARGVDHGPVAREALDRLRGHRSPRTDSP